MYYTKMVYICMYYTKIVTIICWSIDLHSVWWVISWSDLRDLSDLTVPVGSMWSMDRPRVTHEKKTHGIFRYVLLGGLVAINVIFSHSYWESQIIPKLTNSYSSEGWRAQPPTSFSLAGLAGSLFNQPIGPTTKKPSKILFLTQGCKLIQRGPISFKVVNITNLQP